MPISTRLLVILTAACIVSANGITGWIAYTAINAMNGG